jgi:hypothetical protein
MAFSRKRTAVVFASYVPDEPALKLALLYLKTIMTCFSDADVFVGVNPCACRDAWCESLAEAGKRVRVAQVPDHLVIDSDVSAFQAALRSMRDEGGSYDLVWFGHTKGASSRNYDMARLFMERFFYAAAGA